MNITELEAKVKKFETELNDETEKFRNMIADQEDFLSNIHTKLNLSNSQEYCSKVILGLTVLSIVLGEIKQQATKRYVEFAVELGDSKPEIEANSKLLTKTSSFIGEINAFIALIEDTMELCKDSLEECK